MNKTISSYLPTYFSHEIKREIKELYHALTIADIALAMIVLFEPIYFATALKWSLSQIFLFYAAVYAFYIVLIPFGAKVAAHKGYVTSILINIPFQIGYWLVLFSLPLYPQLSWLAALLFALQKTFFWPAFHADLARFSDRDQRARESSIAWSLAQITAIVGPFLGGFISSQFGLDILLLVCSAIYFAMFIPLHSAARSEERRPYFYRDSWAYFKKFPKETVAFFGFGEELIVLTAWPVYIFTLMPNFFDLGLLISGATLIATMVMLYAGRLADKGGGKLVLKAGVVISTLVWVFAPVVRGLWAIFSADAWLRIGRNLFYVTITARVYNRANEEKILPYVVYFEQCLSIGKMLTALICAWLFAANPNYLPIFIFAMLLTWLYLFLPKRKKVLAI